MVLNNGSIKELGISKNWERHDASIEWKKKVYNDQEGWSQFSLFLSKIEMLVGAKCKFRREE